MRRASSSVVLVTLLGALLGLLVQQQQVRSVSERPLPSALSTYAAIYTPETELLHLLLKEGDGQAFAAQAQDPTLRRPELFQGESYAAYRWQRPLYGYLAWATSLGRPAEVPRALPVGLTVAALAAVVALSATVLRRRGASPWWALAVVGLPGVQVGLRWYGPELAGLALALTGLVLATGGPPRRRRGVAATVAFVLAALARETYLLVPIVLAAHQLLVGRVPARALVVRTLAPAAAYLAWITVVWARLGAWPWEAYPGVLTLPFAGLLGVPEWTLVEVLVVAAMAGAAGAALWRGRTDLWAWLAASHLAMGSMMGSMVWSRALDFTRPLLPLGVCAVLSLAPRRAHTTGAPAETEPEVAPAPLAPVGAPLG